MDCELILSASDSDLFDDHSVVPESPPSLVTPVQMQPAISSALHCPRNYVDLAQLLQPLAFTTTSTRMLSTTHSPAQLRHPSPSRARELTAAEFAFAFSLYRDTICSVFPNRRAELNDYLFTILDLALRFDGTGFYTYHFLFASQVAGCLHQFNQGI
eukprot:superscaffoldBa00001287_g9936